ncbi:hypothetical protein H2200_007279 [Cladophialophora chaetospira]|uniref:Zn(2)-C6 fungal-type domain-containing protein n=1 Tax=Cladophialophora chaetospira TaxID=386627 RepID=A0AA39CGY6_9EURO|nr:hypothetical protein H2200_007279 [Cladophialophora chaetospira]
MAQSIEEWRSQSTTMSTSKDFFRINPPKPFCYTDFVIATPSPRVPRGMTEEHAKIKYPRTRLKRLIQILEGRLGKNRCFFAEWQPRDKKKDTQFEVTKLYALHEVDHWDGAFAQYEWTLFVIANMERDAMLAQGAYLAKLALPTLPASALPMYEKMMRREGFGHVRVASMPGQINGWALSGRYRGYQLDDPRRHELHDRPIPNHLLRQSLPGSQPHVSQTVYPPDSDDPLGFTLAQLQEMIRNDEKYRDMITLHRDWISKEYRNLCCYFLRYLARKPAMHLKTWDQLTKETIAELQRRFTVYAQQVCQHLPEVLRELSSAPKDSLMKVQYKVFYAYYCQKDIIPDGASSELQGEFRRKFSISASLRQRRVLREWTTDASRRANQSEGERYRKEVSQIHDLWTGNVEDFAAFDERNRQENTGLTAEMLPLAAQAPIVAPRVEEEDQAQVESHTSPSHVEVQEQQQSVDRSELLAQMQEKAQAGTPKQDNPQKDTSAPALGLREDLAHRPEQMDTEMVDSATADVPEPMHPQDHMEVDDMPRIDGQNQFQAQEVLPLAQELSLPQTLEQFRAELQAAAQEDPGQIAPQSGAPEFGFDPREDVEPRQVRAQIFDGMAVQDQAEDPEAAVQIHSQSRSPPAAAESPVVLERDIIQSELKQVLELEIREPSPSDDHALPPTSPLKVHGPVRLRVEAAAEAVEPVKSQILQPEVQEVIRVQSPDQDQVQLENELATAAAQEQDTVHAELEESLEPTIPLEGTSSHSITLGDGEATKKMNGSSADSPATQQEETQACTSPSASSNHQADEQTQNSTTIKKCNYCHKSQKKCNGERPCQHCIKYKRNCYELNQPPEKTRGSNLKNRNAAENKKTEKAVDEELPDVQAAGSDNAMAQAPEDESSLQPIRQDQAEANAPEHNPDEIIAQASESELSEVETLPSLPFRTPKPENNIEIVIRKAPMAQPEAKATKAPQKAKQTTRLGSSVTTRRAEKKMAEQNQRALRSRVVSK